MLFPFDWLDTRLYQNSLFYLDLWSLVILWLGFVLFFAFRFLKIKWAILLTGCSVALVKIVAGFFTSLFFLDLKNLFLQDLFLDTALAMVGGFLGSRFILYSMKYTLKYRSHIFHTSALLSAVTYAFFWVGSYRYNYNLPTLNTPGINLFSFFLWTAGGYGTILYFRMLNIKSSLFRFILTWIPYIIILFIVEFIGYSILGIHENSKPGALSLLFGLIHGNRILHFFYLTSPVWTISFYSAYRRLIHYCANQELYLLSASQKESFRIAHNY